MKTRMKKWTAILLAAALSLIGFSTASAAEAPVKVVLNGEVLSFSVDPIVINGRTYVEFRTLFSKLGYQVDYDNATRTIKATSPQRQIEMTLGKDTVLVDGNPVDGKDQIRLVKGRTMVGLRFVSTLSGKEVDWDGASNTATIRDTGPSGDEKSVLDFFDMILELEAARDRDGLLALFTEDSPIDADSLLIDLERIQTKTTFEELDIDFLSDSEAIVRTTEITEKIGGDSFYLNNRAQYRYTLHKKDGQWNIYDLELLDAEIYNPYGLFDQAVTVPDDVSAALLSALEKQIQATKEEDLDAVMSTLYFEDEEEKYAVSEILQAQFELMDTITTLEKFAVVEYNGSDEALLLLAIEQELVAEDESSRFKAIIQGGAWKVDGNWLLDAWFQVLYSEPAE